MSRIRLKICQVCGNPLACAPWRHQKVYLAFFENVLKLFNEINIFFNIRKLAFTCCTRNAFNFSRESRVFFKKPLLPFLTSGNIQFDDPDNQLALEEVYLGEECNDIDEKMLANENSESEEIVRRVRKIFTSRPLFNFNKDCSTLEMNFSLHFEFSTRKQH